LQKLDTFVQGGGGVAFFMGALIREPKFYNEKLYNDGKGMFPAPLKEIANKNMTEQELADERSRHLRPTHIHGKLVVKSAARRHPALFRLSEARRSSAIAASEYEIAFIGVWFPRLLGRRSPAVEDDRQRQPLIPRLITVHGRYEPQVIPLIKAREKTDGLSSSRLGGETSPAANDVERRSTRSGR
jgi:hypothetical protein